MARSIQCKARGVYFVRGSGFGFRGSLFGVRCSGFAARGSGFGVRCSGSLYRTPNSACRITALTSNVPVIVGSFFAVKVTGEGSLLRSGFAVRGSLYRTPNSELRLPNHRAHLERPRDRGVLLCGEGDGRGEFISFGVRCSGFAVRGSLFGVRCTELGTPNSAYRITALTSNVPVIVGSFFAVKVTVSCSAPAFAFAPSIVTVIVSLARGAMDVA